MLALLSPSNLEHLPLLKKRLPEVYPHIDIISPKDLDDLGRIVRGSARRHRLVLVVGGDGTLNQVLNHLDVDKQVLGILPAGTGNDFARVLKFPRRLADRIGHLAQLAPRPLDYGLINKRRFINSGGFGIDSRTLLTRQQSKGFVARNYNVAFLVSLFKLRSYSVKVDCDGERLDGEYFWVLAMNTPYIGGGTQIAPRAQINDGRLDLLLVKRTSRLNLARFLPATIKGRHLDLPLAVYRQAREVRVTLDQPLDYLALDGELALCGERELQIRAAGERLLFLR
ncbi:YegS/Rv2252/BmrU family lipid kinase [bacterium]|nr:YegS/Rv2252/BmrU family lipid kinase [bacterium]